MPGRTPDELVRAAIAVAGDGMAQGELHADGRHDMHLHARVRGDT